MMMHILLPLVFWSCINVTELIMLCNSMLVFQWPRTVCLKKMCKINGQLKSTCRNEVKQSLDSGGYKRLTIHGLWELGKNTACNNNGPDFNVNEIGTDKIEALNKIFPNLVDVNTVFWKYEWNKHGKKTGLTIAEYFGKTLYLHDIYGTNLTNAINGVCNPGTNGMSVQGFSDCITLKAGIQTPNIVLFEDLLWEIRICFDIHFLPIACPYNNLNTVLKLPPVNHIQKRSTGDDPMQWSDLYDDEFDVCPFVTTRNGAVTIFTRQVILLLLLLAV